MNKLAPLYDSLEFSFLGYYIRDVRRGRGGIFCGTDGLKNGGTGGVLFLA